MEVFPDQPMAWPLALALFYRAILGLQGPSTHQGLDHSTLFALHSYFGQIRTP